MLPNTNLNTVVSAIVTIIYAIKTLSITDFHHILHITFALTNVTTVFTSFDNLM